MRRERREESPKTKWTKCRRHAQQTLRRFHSSIRLVSPIRIKSINYVKIYLTESVHRSFDHWPADGGVYAGDQSTMGVPLRNGLIESAMNALKFTKTIQRHQRGNHNWQRLIIITHRIWFHLIVSCQLSLACCVVMKNFLLSLDSPISHKWVGAVFYMAGRLLLTINAPI